MTRKLDAEIAVPAQCELAEGPVWDAGRGLLRWVDILRGRVHALDPVSGAHSWFDTGDQVGTAGLTRDGGLVLALSDRFARCDHDGQNLMRLDGFTVDGSVFRFNDGKPDPWGNLWAGTCTLAEQGPPCTLYKLSPDGAVTDAVRRHRPVQRPGLVRGPEDVLFRRQLRRGSGRVRHRPGHRRTRRPRRFAEVSGGLPDGLTLDAEGGLWLAVWGSGELRRYLPDGRVDVVVSLPVTQVTSAAFGGADLSTLYITDSQGELHSRRPGRPAARGRHLRLHPRRHRAPAIPVQPVSSRSAPA